MPAIPAPITLMVLGALFGAGSCLIKCAMGLTAMACSAAPASCDKSGTAPEFSDNISKDIAGRLAKKT